VLFFKLVCYFSFFFRWPLPGNFSANVLVGSSTAEKQPCMYKQTLVGEINLPQVNLESLGNLSILSKRQKYRTGQGSRKSYFYKITCYVYDRILKANLVGVQLE